MENKIDNVNNPNHYQLDCGIESIEIIRIALGKEYFCYFYLGNILKYLIRAEKKNKLEDYKKARKYLEWLVENNEDNKSFIYLYNLEEYKEETGFDWSNIILSITKNMSIEMAFKLDSIFRNILSDEYSRALKDLDDFIKEYEELHL